MFTLSQVTNFAIIPAAVSLVSILLSGAISRRVSHATEKVRQVSMYISAIGLGGGYLFAQARILGWPAIPPTEALHWIFLLVPISLIFHQYVNYLKTLPKIVCALLVFWSIALTCVLWTPIQHLWSRWESIAIVFGYSFVGILCAASLKMSTKVMTAGCSLFIPAVMFVFGGLALYFSGSWVLAQLCFAFSSALAAHLILLKAGWAKFEIICPVQTFFLPFYLILVTGYFYSELPSISLILFLIVGIPNVFLAKVLTNHFEGSKLRNVRMTIFFLPLAVSAWLAYYLA